LEKVSNDGDSIGGVIETAVINLPIGLGDPIFDNVESMLISLFLLFTVMIIIIFNSYCYIV